MSSDAYRRLANILHTLPSGFPPTESGAEIKLLQKVFEPDEAELFCRLRLTYETADQIAARTGIRSAGLNEKLESMWEKGQIESRLSGGERVFRMCPWVVGIYEYQLRRMDKEFVDLCEQRDQEVLNEAIKAGRPMTKPQMMQVLPVERVISENYQALPYEKVSSIIENGKSFAVSDCICRKRKGMVGQECDRPLEICMAIGDEPGLFKDHPMVNREITKQEAYELLQKAEDAALVHMTTNVVKGQWYICNCCKCCDRQLMLTAAGIPGIINSHFYAEIDSELCSACGTCADERCQVKAIDEADGTYGVNRSKCIGCGLCVSTCPTEAIQLFHKKPEEIESPAEDEIDWWEKKAKARGVDYSAFK